MFLMNALPTNQPTDQPTDQPTNRSTDKAYYRDARTHLRMYRKPFLQQNVIIQPSRTTSTWITQHTDVNGGCNGRGERVDVIAAGGARRRRQRRRGAAFTATLHPGLVQYERKVGRGNRANHRSTLSRDTKIRSPPCLKLLPMEFCQPSPLLSYALN